MSILNAAEAASVINVPLLSCQQYRALITDQAAENWGDEVDLRTAAELHLRKCPDCYAMKVNLEMAYEAAIRASAGRRRD